MHHCTETRRAQLHRFARRLQWDLEKQKLIKDKPKACWLSLKAHLKRFEGSEARKWRAQARRRRRLKSCLIPA